MTRKDTPRPLAVLLPTLLVAGLVLADQSNLFEVRVASEAKDSEIKREALETYNQLPLTFEPNRGQSGTGVQFTAHGGSYVMGLAPTEANIAVWSRVPKKGRNASSRTASRRQLKKEDTELVSANVRMKLLGSNAKAQARAEGELQTRVNYLKGNDRSKWVTNVPVYEKVRYQGVYPGIDMVYYGNQKKYEYDFVVKPGAAPGDITLKFDGAKDVAVDPKTGELVVALSQGELRQGRPIMFQETFGQREEVSGSYALLGNNEVAFNVDGYDPTRELVIDPPILGYSGLLGGITFDEAHDVVVDSSGYAYVLGITISADFPVTPAIPSPPSDYGVGYDLTQNDGQTDWDVTLSKVAPPGTPVNETRARLVYSTYFGGNRGDHELAEPGAALARDASGRLYFICETESDNYPVSAGAISPTRIGQSDIGLTILNAAGSAVVYSTYFGGTFGEFTGGIDLDADGGILISGRTDSGFNNSFPLANAVDSNPESGTEAFVTRFVPSFGGTTTLTTSFSTYLGGTKIDVGEDVDSWKDGSNLYVYVSGTTYSQNYPISHPIQVHAATTDNSTDGFVTKLLWNGSSLSLVWSTFLGGTSEDHAYALKVRQTDGKVFVTGRISTTPLAFQADPLKTGASASNPVAVTGISTVAFGNSDAYLISLRDPANLADPNSRIQIDYWTVFGALGYDQGLDVEFDPADGTGNTVWLAGMSSSQTNTTPAFPTANAVIDTKTGGDASAFIAKINTLTAGLPGVEVSTFWGGSSSSSHDYGMAIAPAADNCPILVGYTSASEDFPVVAGPQLNYGGGGYDGFVAKICPNDAGAFQIFKVDVTSVGASSAVVTWQTNRASNSRVKIGTAAGTYFREVQPTLNYPSETVGNVFTHRVVIGDGLGTATALPANTPTTDSPLSPNTFYWIRVESTTPSAVSAASADVKILTTAPYPKFRINSTTFRPASNPGKFFTQVKIRNTGGVTANSVDITRVRFWSLKGGKTNVFQDWEARYASGSFLSPAFGMPTGSGTATGNVGVNNFGYLQYQYDDAVSTPGGNSHAWNAGQSVRIDITGTYINSAGPGGTFAASHRIRMPARPTNPATLP